jgi:hypothetical protein
VIALFFCHHAILNWSDPARHGHKIGVWSTGILPFAQNDKCNLVTPSEAKGLNHSTTALGHLYLTKEGSQ